MQKANKVTILSKQITCKTIGDQTRMHTPIKYRKGVNVMVSGRPFKNLTVYLNCDLRIAPRQDPHKYTRHGLKPKQNRRVSSRLTIPPKV